MSKIQGPKPVDPNLPVFMDLALEGISLPARVHECPVLHVGFTQRTEGENPLHLARHIPPGGRLGISIFNLPMFGDPKTGLDITDLSLKISFAASRNNQVEATPFAQITFDRFLIYRAEPEPNYETAHAFGAIADVSPQDPTRYQVWNAVHDDSNTTPAYPARQLQGGTAASSPTLEPIQAKDGGFFVTVVLDVVLANLETVTFRVDPEMIVQTGGPHL